ncbi:MAG TPA: Gfo/Idh/MocA family oxidoreductase [Longimicrobiaceae bacterium]|nr:Gfo/Idh/MocA family oxidoreductase [Longimicrobiaceae bacterium]
MTAAPLRTVVVGLGKIGLGYADDPVMARHYPFATHAQVLARHPAFEWGGAVDLAPEARRAACERWGVPLVAAEVGEVADAYRPEVVVLATPPESRLEILEQLPDVRAVLVEKPLGRTLEEGESFLAWCRARGIPVQVALWRRADAAFRELALTLGERIGAVQAAFALYGNGLLNNGTHVVDFVRMLLGEVTEVQAAAGVAPYREGPIRDDVNLPFHLALASGAGVSVQPLRFAHFRENGVDIWGESGRLSVLQEGLKIRWYPRRENRGMQGEREVDSDCPVEVPSTVGHAFYALYDDLAEALRRGTPLCSPGESALRTARVVQAVLDSSARGGAPVRIG